MLFRVSHTSRYEYDVPVRLGVHRLRLLPRRFGTITRRADIWVAPAPDRVQESVDPEGNVTRSVDFSGETRVLEVRSSLDVEVQRPDDFRGTLPPLPWSRLAPVAAEYYGAAPSADIGRFADALRARSQTDPREFLDRALGALFGFTRHLRPTGPARAPEETLELRSGACRDLTVLFLALCQSQGIAGRFVSGYQAEADTADGERHLHAWAEVYLGDAGWCGYDPMYGLRVRDGHLALASGPTQASTMPIEGSFSFDGPELNSTLSHSVRIQTD